MYQYPMDGVSGEILVELFKRSLNQSDRCSSSVDVGYNLDSPNKSRQRTKEQQPLCCVSGLKPVSTKFKKPRVHQSDGLCTRPSLLRQAVCVTSVIDELTQTHLLLNSMDYKYVVTFNLC